MLEKCEVLGCPNVRPLSWHAPCDFQPETDQISFFAFPLDEPFRTGWVRFTGRPLLENPHNPVLCSVHFRKRCFLVQKEHEFGRPVLLHGSMPTLFPALDRLAPAIWSPSMFLPAGRKFENPRKMLEMVMSFSRPAVPPLAFVPAKDPFDSPRKTIEDIENFLFEF